MAQELLLPPLPLDVPPVSCVVTTADWGDIVFIARVRFMLRNVTSVGAKCRYLTTAGDFCTCVMIRVAKFSCIVLADRRSKEWNC